MILLLFLIHGTVMDSQKHSVAEAAVTLQSTAVQLKTTTGSTGAFRFPEVPAGSYTIRAGKKDIGETTFGPFDLAANESKQIDLTLQTLDFNDEPKFVVAGVTDTTARGGHGSDTVLRSAESLAQATASLGPESPEAVRLLLRLAVALYTNGSYDQAAQRFFEACDKNPPDPTPYLFLAKVQTVAITNLPGYEERMARFARLQPNNAEAQYYYAVSLWKQHKGPEQVAALLNKAVQLDPALGKAYLQLGILHFDQEHLKEAQAAFEKAIELTPSLVEAHYRLAQTYRRLGNPAAAKKELAIYDQLSKESAQEAERRRAELRQFIDELRK
jgi:tetratricopeptide (TPR) repeat protein